MDQQQKALEAFNGWFGKLRVHKASGGPAKGTICAALVVLERLKFDFNLDLKSHRAAGGSQIKGAGGQAVKKILASFGEVRPFTAEGGRTNRGGPGDILAMLETLQSLGIDKLSEPNRNTILHDMQSYLVERIIDFHGRQRIKLIFDPSVTTWQTIQRLLAAARETGKEGPVAQHMVGAKLELRFPELSIGKESYSTADRQLGRPGDFLIGDTAFHVTVSPMQQLFAKCVENVNEGYRAFILVPDRILSGTRQNADLTLSGRICVESIESFVATNIEELSIFTKDNIVHGMRRLLETYNQRVSVSELDKSMMIEIPRNI